MCNSNKAKNDSNYSRLFARIYNPVMNNLERKFLRLKREELLKELKGDILEVGAGTGINFDIYNPDQTKVFAFEPSEAMLGFARQKMESMAVNKHIKLIKAGVGDVLPADAIPEEGFDYVVCTLVLCTIPDAKAALEAISGYLKPDGKLLVLEHIKAKSGFGRFVQNSLNPIWKHCAEGCHLNRPTDLLLKAMGYIADKESYFSKIIPFYMASLRFSGKQ
jgi:ubiquinone/menaquinone biosynthesis C-methylase UbiE